MPQANPERQPWGQQVPPDRDGMEATQLIPLIPSAYSHQRQPYGPSPNGGYSGQQRSPEPPYGRDSNGVPASYYRVLGNGGVIEEVSVGPDGRETRTYTVPTPQGGTPSTDELHIVADRNTGHVDVQIRGQYDRIPHGAGSVMHWLLGRNPLEQIPDTARQALPAGSIYQADSSAAPLPLSGAPAASSTYTPESCGNSQPLLTHGVHNTAAPSTADKPKSPIETGNQNGASSPKTSVRKRLVTAALGVLLFVGVADLSSYVYTNVTSDISYDVNPLHWGHLHAFEGNPLNFKANLLERIP